MVGSLILVVGPSGVGKDSVIDGAKGQLETDLEVYFPRRYITRARAAGGENHIEVSDQVFTQMRDADQFCLHWRAHKLQYGLPAHIMDRLSMGQTVFVNGSRSILEIARQQFSNLRIAHITASEESLRNRLDARGRETPEDIEQRIQRSTAFKLAGDDVTEIDNSGSLERAVEQLIRLSQIPTTHIVLKA